MKTQSNIQNTTNAQLIEEKTHSLIFNCLLWFTLLGYLFACFMSFYKKELYADILLNCVWIPMAIVIGYCLYQKIYFRQKLFVLCFVFLIWMIITYLLKGDYMLNDPTNRTFLISHSLLCLLVLPFSYILNDKNRRKHLDTFLCIIIIITAALLWLSYIAVLRGENISLFNDRFVFGATYTYTDRMMLQFFNLYYYKTGYLALACFFITLYLSVAHWSRRYAVLFIFLLLTFTIAVIITYSRTAVFTFVIGLIIALYILLLSLPLKKNIRRIILIVCTVGGIIFAAIVLNFTYKFFNSVRDIWFGISTLSSRTDIWMSVTDAINDNSSLLIYGLPINESMTIMNSYIALDDTISNMHSGYLQTLILIGIPGLIMVMAFCLYLVVAIVKIIFSTNYEIYPASIKILTILPVCCLIMNLVESLVLFNPVQSEILNLLMFLCSGYILEYAFPKNKEDKLNIK